MYTVKELIETLKQCPEHWQVLLHSATESGNIDAVGIDDNEETIDLFME